MYTKVSTPQVIDTKYPEIIKGNCLVIDKHPIESFYKDEGGKANHLIAVAHLAQPELRLFEEGGIPVTCGLYYESGIRVEDGDEILNILSFEPKIITSADTRIELRYRIEKVSRRKDGQRFKVRFEVDSKAAPKAAARIQGAFTSPVLVLSKRFKSNGNDGTAAPPKQKHLKRDPHSNHGPPSKRRNTGTKKYVSVDEFQRFISKFKVFEKQNDHLNKRVQLQEERIIQLENELKAKSQHTRHFDSKKNGAPVLYWDDFDPVIKPDPHTNHSKQGRISDLQLNFGAPCPSPLPLEFELENVLP